MEVGLGKSKTASRNLRNALPDICAFAARSLHRSQADTARPGIIVVACETGRDISIGAALALWCRLYDDDGNLRPQDGAGVSFTKDAIKARLGVIMMKYPDVNPNRATLQSVNSYLMDWN